MKKYFIVLLMALLIPCVSCKRVDESTSKGGNSSVQVEQQQDSDSVVEPQKEEIDFGNDELSEGLETLYNDGCFFSFDKPSCITNRASRVDMYPSDEDLGNLGLVSAPLQVDDGGVTPERAVVWVYKGEKNLRDGAQKALELAYSDTAFEGSEAFASFIPQKELELNGFTLKDAYPYSLTEKYYKEYEGTHLVIFVWKDKKLYYAFIIR